MLNVQDTFGGPLRRDPAIALDPIEAQPLRSGPLPKIQYVVEIAGPRSLVASSATVLLTPQWQAALGSPACWVMAPADQAWRPMDAKPDGSYDSLCLAWDITSEKGLLSQETGQHLLGILEGYAAKVSRRALPMPTPDQIDALATHWKSVQDNLDIGFTVALVNPSGPIPEREIWRLCAAMGLDFGPKGSFDWRAEDWEFPLLSLTPLEEEAFSLAGVQDGLGHSGVSMGFNVPRSPNPAAVMKGCLQIVDQFTKKLACQVFDESMNPMGPTEMSRLQTDLAAALDLFKKAALTPGSAEALRLFPTQ